MVRIYRGPFYDGHLERYEYGVKNSYEKSELFPNGMFMVMERDNNSPRSEEDTESIWRSPSEPNLKKGISRSLFKGRIMN